MAPSVGQLYIRENAVGKLKLVHWRSHRPSEGGSGRSRAEGIQHVPVSVSHHAANQLGTKMIRIVKKCYWKQKQAQHKRFLSFTKHLSNAEAETDKKLLIKIEEKLKQAFWTRQIKTCLEKAKTQTKRLLLLQPTLWALRCYKKALGLALGSFWFLNLAASQTPINWKILCLMLTKVFLPM